MEDPHEQQQSAILKRVVTNVVSSFNILFNTIQ